MDDQKLHSVQKKLELYQTHISATEFFSSSLAVLERAHFSRIRCLALGSPANEFQALYQLAFLKLIVSEFKILPDRVSLYDPAFQQCDVHLLTITENFVIEDPDTYRNKSSSPDHILYYMPHAPRSVIEETVREEHPRWVLGNDISVTIGTLGRAAFLERYPNLAKLLTLSESSTATKSVKMEANEDTDDFLPVVSRRTRNKPKKNVYIEPKLVYDYSSSYFSGIKIDRMKSSKNAPWKDSFSDLAFNEIICKNTIQFPTTI